MMELNSLGLPKKEYEGAKSTLCTGCGHDSVTQHIISACYQSGVDSYQVAKLSGIGCSSKTPAYFLKHAHGFNTIHGRMAAVATGAKLANRNLVVLGVSGDGDTASIGLGSFSHLIRRNLPMVYIVENNGVYGLTKGQFSATADFGSTIKGGESSPFLGIDICGLAIELGCAFVARSFSGDGKQLEPLIAAALRHPGTAVIDVISPCVAFANHEGSTRSYDRVRKHKVALQELGFFAAEKAIEVEQEEGKTTSVRLPDGSLLHLRRVSDHQHELTDAVGALRLLHESRHRGEILTGLLYHDAKSKGLDEILGMTVTPLRDLTENELRPSSEQLEQALSEFR
jgi:2-oxoglutarate/2-oxoacid ferredoxin oxidoreductase subunit beta